MTGDYKAVVLLSGGQDSTTCLFWALDAGYDVHCVSFNYGQRHIIELEAGEKIAKLAGVPRKVLSLDLLAQIGDSALLDPSRQILPDGGHHGLPTSFVPGRNILMLTAAAAYAVKIGASTVVGGMAQTDYSGYPDCRRETLDALEVALRLGMEPIKIITPLMFLNKAHTVRLAKSLGVKCWEAMVHTVTCYLGKVPACGECPACLLRKKGFHDAGYSDPAEVHV